MVGLARVITPAIRSNIEIKEPPRDSGTADGVDAAFRQVGIEVVSYYFTALDHDKGFLRIFDCNTARR